MQYSSFALLGLASTALALPQTAEGDVPYVNEPFGMQVEGPGFNALNNQVTAYGGVIWVNGSSNASCVDGTFADFATFEWYSDRRLQLYKTDYPPQNVYVDAAAKHAGALDYYTQGVNEPLYAGLTGFSIDALGFVSYVGLDRPWACPNGSGQWSLWFTQSSSPGGQLDCVRVTLTAYKTPNRVACTYTEPQLA